MKTYTKCIELQTSQNNLNFNLYTILFICYRIIMWKEKWSLKKVSTNNRCIIIEILEFSIQLLLLIIIKLDNTVYLLTLVSEFKIVDSNYFFFSFVISFYFIFYFGDLGLGLMWHYCHTIIHQSYDKVMVIATQSYII